MDVGPEVSVSAAAASIVSAAAAVRSRCGCPATAAAALCVGGRQSYRYNGLTTAISRAGTSDFLTSRRLHCVVRLPLTEGFPDPIAITGTQNLLDHPGP
jgi:hypothetical protein